jgi:phage terminase large subunit-like protein
MVNWLQGQQDNKQEETTDDFLYRLIRTLKGDGEVAEFLTSLPTGLSDNPLLWPVICHDHQRAPDASTDWSSWLILGGRGAGKTRAGAEWIKTLVETRGIRRIALVGETYDDVREVMIAGESGLINIASPGQRPQYTSSRHLLSWPNGAEAYGFSSADPDGLRGYQFEAAWSDELCKWTYAEDTWSNLQLGLRLGQRPRQVITTTPRPGGLLRTILSRKSTTLSHASTYENRANLAAAFLEEVTDLYGKTRLGRQELLGEILQDQQDALWNWKLIEASRIKLAPPLDRIVVAVDPPAKSGPEADECGIVVAGTTMCGGEKTAFVLEDASCAGLSPMEWGSKVVNVYQRHQADCVVVETNQGGDMVGAILRQIDPLLPIRSVHASRSKIARAEPVAMMYERGVVRHVGAFPALEDQMVSYVAEASTSPDRLDALVWALTELVWGRARPEPSIRFA